MYAAKDTILGLWSEFEVDIPVLVDNKLGVVFP